MCIRDREEPRESEPPAPPPAPAPAAEGELFHDPNAPPSTPPRSPAAPPAPLGSPQRPIVGSPSGGIWPHKRTMKVTVPPGAAPNKMLQATSPTGERVAFFPPAGAGGRDVYLPLDDATAGPAPPPVAAPIPAPGGQLTWGEADASAVAPPSAAAAAPPAPQPYAAPPQPPPAATAAPGMIEIQVPEGAPPGATLEFVLDDGRTIDITVPEGARAGDRLQVPTDTADAPPPPPAVPRQTAPAATPETICLLYTSPSPRDRG